MLVSALEEAASHFPGVEAMMSAISGTLMRSRLRTLTLANALLLVLACRATLYGQLALNVEATESTDETSEQQRPFILPKQSTEVAEAMDDFNRYVKKGTWEKAFKSLEKATSSTSDGLVARPDGLMLPGRLLVRQSLAALPAEGKAAYRVFHDAEAKDLLEKAKGPGEAESLSKIVTNYLITSAGDIAANRLGELYFEQDEMAKAAECWQSVLTYRPESSIPRIELLTKRGIALARARRWDDFHEVLHQVQEKHAGETVELGGQKIVAAEHLAALGEQGPKIQAALGEPADLKLPSSNEPLWQFKFLMKEDPNPSNRGIMINDPWGRNVVTDMVIPTAATDSRVYANFLGYDIGLDLATGKVLWRSGKFHDLPQKSRNQQGLSLDRYSIAAQEDRVWSVGRDPAQLGQQGGNFYLVCRDGATGKELLNSKSIKDLQSYSMSGAPLTTGDRLYVTGSKSGQNTQLTALCIAAKDGKLLWSTHLGNHKIDPSQVYGQRAAQPSLLLHGDKLYVDTHAGALVQLESASGALNWAVGYESGSPNTGYNYYQVVSVFTSGQPQAAGDKVFFKGMRSSRLMAVSPDAPAVAWKRPVSESALLIGFDAQRVYLGGEELTAYDLKTQKLLWSNRVPLGTGWIKPLMTANRLYQFTPRGIYEIDKQTGRATALFRGSDLESLGGAILLTPKALLTVSNLAITAYPLDQSAAVAAHAEEPASSVTK